ncbi:MAG: hypothetical protein HQL71_09465 [Magnetococcales bacterium]|nr:hypothetical protein [Magnetococcales bacterium]
MAFWTGWQKNKRQKKLQREQVMAVHDRIVDHLFDIIKNGNLKIEDDYDLRFDLMIFFASYLLFCKKEDVEFSQSFWEIVFEGIQESLRLRGVTDVRMGARMGQAYTDATARRNAYIAAWETEDNELLRKAIARNILCGAKPDDKRVETIIAGLEGFEDNMMNS